MNNQTHSHNEQQQLVLPWKTRVSLFFLNSVTTASLRPDGTVNRRIFRSIDYLGFKKPPTTTTTTTTTTRVKTSDITVDPFRNLWFRIFVPRLSESESESRLPIVVFFHGGGFVFLSPDFKAYDDVCRRFARKLPAVVVSVNYRLAPEHRYPAQFDDGFDVLKFLDQQTHILPPNADVSRCFLAGDSAGGNIAHHVAKRVCDSNSKFTRLKVIGVVAIQPFFGGEERTKSEIELAGVDPIVSMSRTDWMWKALLPDAVNDRDHEVINVSGPRAAEISKLDIPATMVVVAGFDSLKDWQIRYYDWLKNSGKEAYLLQYPNMIHAFYIFPELADSGHLISEIKNFIHKQCLKYTNSVAI